MHILEKVVLQASRRNVIGKQVGALRQAGKLPAVLYGHHVDSTPIVLDAHETTLTLSRLTSSSLVIINLEGTEYPTLVREKQRHPVKHHLIHLDFQALSLTEKTHVTVGIELTGTAPAIKTYGAVLVHPLTELEVECLPQEMPERVVVDISGLVEIGDAIHVRDLQLPGGVEILTDPEEVIVSATAARAEEAAPAAEEEAAEPELIKSKKEEKTAEE
uniref:Large ribosomal subunit protein bL25 n=1 Tax=Desulfobacca acetoxidans TaxID=60893 RepID=A0A7V6A2U1_9BACT